MKLPVVVALFLTATLIFGAPSSLSPEVEASLADIGLQKVTGAPPMADVALSYLDGSKNKLSSFHGKVVVLNFWATWCPPCQREMPGMEKLHQSLKNDPDFILLAVDSMEPPATVREFIQKNGYHFSVPLDQDGSVTNLYSVQAYPTTYVIDRQGKVIGGIIGEHDWGTTQVLKGFQRLLATR